MQDRVEFVKKLSALAEALGAKMSEAKLWIYEQALCRFSDEQIGRAIAGAASALTFFPKPAELIELIQGKPEEQSTLAWEALLFAMQHVGAYQSVLFEDGRIARAVRLLGGWEKACRTESKYLNHFRSDFVKVFNSLPADTEPEALEGIFELNAPAQGYPDRIKPPVEVPSREARGLSCSALRTEPGLSTGDSRRFLGREEYGSAGPHQKAGHKIRRSDQIMKNTKEGRLSTILSKAKQMPAQLTMMRDE